MNLLCRGVPAAACLLVLVACGTPMTREAEKVRIITASEKDARCESLGVVSAEQSLGPNKLGNAMNKALNEVASRGGNGFFLVASGSVGIDGASVAGEALRCRN